MSARIMRKRSGICCASARAISAFDACHKRCSSSTLQGWRNKSSRNFFTVVRSRSPIAARAPNMSSSALANRKKILVEFRKQRVKFLWEFHGDASIVPGISPFHGAPLSREQRHAQTAGKARQENSGKHRGEGNEKQ